MAPVTRGSAKRRSANALFNCMDLLIEILMLLPAKQILKCKAVSRYWYSVISSPLFIITFAKRNPNPLSGLVLNGRLDTFPEFFFVSLTGNSRAGRLQRYLRIPRIKILNFCNGLLCYSQPHNNAPEVSSYYVCNPTSGETRRMRVFQSSAVRRLMAVNLAFDPLISAFYNLIFVFELFKSDGLQLIKVDVYSSKTESWRSRLFFVSYDVGFGNGVHWNGAIYWYHEQSNTLAYFDFDTDCFDRLEMPPLDSPYPMYLDCFGESGGRLLIVGTLGPTRTQFTIFEMKHDRSGWFVKFRSLFNTLASTFPRMARTDHFSRYVVSVATVLKGEKEEDWSIVLCVPGSVVQYNIRDGTTKKLRGLPEGFVFHQFSPVYSTFKAYKCIETLACL